MTMTDHLLGLTDELPRAGRVSGYVKIPFSSDLSAYGFIPLPIAIVSGSDGPTVLVLAGSFGDETESPVAAAQVARMLDPATMAGRVIVVPMANQPAAHAGTRNSPVDGRNLNRSYPGDVRGTPTSIIADYIERHLMSVSDLVLDLHSDGRSIHYVPSVAIIHHPDPDLRADRLGAAVAFGAPNLLVFHSFEERNSSGAARRAGTVRIATEMGGPDPIAATVAGVLRALAWIGITSGVPKPPRQTCTVHVIRQDKDFIYALHDGVFEPLVALGSIVCAGDRVGLIHDPSRPFDKPIVVTSDTGGTVVCTRGPGLTARGDCVLHLAGSADAELIAEVEAAGAMGWNGPKRGFVPAAPAPTARQRRRKPKDS
jgi:predicted deacylase